MSGSPSSLLTLLPLNTITITTIRGCRFSVRCGLERRGATNVKVHVDQRKLRIVGAPPNLELGSGGRGRRRRRSGPNPWTRRSASRRTWLCSVLVPRRCDARFITGSLTMQRLTHRCPTVRGYLSTSVRAFVFRHRENRAPPFTCHYVQGR